MDGKCHLFSGFNLRAMAGQETGQWMGQWPPALGRACSVSNRLKTPGPSVDIADLLRTGTKAACQERACGRHLQNARWRLAGGGGERPGWKSIAVHLAGTVAAVGAMAAAWVGDGSTRMAAIYSCRSLAHEIDCMPSQTPLVPAVVSIKTQLPSCLFGRGP